MTKGKPDLVGIPDGARSAKSISLGKCEHGTIFIMLRDEKGEVFAYGSMDQITALELANDIAENVGIDVGDEATQH